MPDATLRWRANASECVWVLKGNCADSKFAWRQETRPCHAAVRRDTGSPVLEQA